MLDGGGAFIYGAAHWAAPAYQAGLFESGGRIQASSRPMAGCGAMRRPIYESAAAVKHCFLLVFCFWRPSGRLLSEITIHDS